MFLQQLEISGFRNLTTSRLRFDRHVNVFWGLNGSGKTSLLEAIHVLGMGRSFKATSLRHVVKLGCDQYALGGHVMVAAEGVAKVGAERTVDGVKRFKLAEKYCAPADVARVLPLQAITIDSHKLIDAGPEYRRRFMDWAVFHVEHGFWDIWREFRESLLQRNAALKQSGGNKRDHNHALAAWQPVFVAAAEAIDHARKAFLHEFEPVLLETMADWLPKKRIELRYRQGWSKEFTLEQALAKNLREDLAFGFSGVGPHRADLDILVDGLPAKAIVSRGQQKLLVCALLLARARLLLQKQHKKSIFLLDDLNSELDEHASKLLLQKLLDLNCQIFVTNIEQKPLSDRLSALNQGGSMFKVSGGAISQSG